MAKLNVEINPEYQQHILKQIWRSSRGYLKYLKKPIESVMKTKIKMLHSNRRGIKIARIEYL